MRPLCLSVAEMRPGSWGEMAPRLEEQGNPRLRLCLHNRDFEVRLK